MDCQIQQVEITAVLLQRQHLTVPVGAAGRRGPRPPEAVHGSQLLRVGPIGSGGYSWKATWQDQVLPPPGKAR